MSSCLRKWIHEFKLFSYASRFHLSSYMFTFCTNLWTEEMLLIYQLYKWMLIIEDKIKYIRETLFFSVFKMTFDNYCSSSYIFIATGSHVIDSKILYIDIYIYICKLEFFLFLKNYVTVNIYPCNNLPWKYVYCIKLV